MSALRAFATGLKALLLLQLLVLAIYIDGHLGLLPAAEQLLPLYAYVALLIAALVYRQVESTQPKHRNGLRWARPIAYLTAAVIVIVHWNGGWSFNDGFRWWVPAAIIYLPAVQDAITALYEATRSSSAQTKARADEPLLAGKIMHYF